MPAEVSSGGKYCYVGTHPWDRKPLPPTPLDPRRGKYHTIGGFQAQPFDLLKPGLTSSSSSISYASHHSERHSLEPSLINDKGRDNKLRPLDPPDYASDILPLPCHLTEQTYFTEDVGLEQGSPTLSLYSTATYLGEGRESIVDLPSLVSDPFATENLCRFETERETPHSSQGSKTWSLKTTEHSEYMLHANNVQSRQPSHIVKERLEEFRRKVNEAKLRMHRGTSQRLASFRRNSEKPLELILTRPGHWNSRPSTIKAVALRLRTRMDLINPFRPKSNLCRVKYHQLS